MKAVVLDFESRRLERRDLPEPRLERATDVLIRIREVGVCGTDRELASFSFGYPPAGDSFLVLGHEAVGQVVGTGPAVTSLSPGDWVLPSVRRACDPPCANCARGRRDLCLSGGYRERGIYGLHGYFSEYAVDSEQDLVRVPADLLECAVLIEPLSVVEKAIATAVRMHESGPRRALVIGAGAVGILAALALQARGLDVAVQSLEDPDHPRARIVRAAGIRYQASGGGGEADIVIEAAGAAEAAVTGVRSLARSGVCALLGAKGAPAGMELLDLIVKSQTVFGSVNASPESFRDAVIDLGRFDRRVLGMMIRRAGFGDLEHSILGPLSDTPKTVHVVGE